MPDIDPNTIELDPRQVADHVGDGTIVLVDVRTDDEHDVSRIAGALHIPLEQLSGRAGELPDDGRPVVFYCRVGARSMMAAQAVRAIGRQAHSMAGGIVAYNGEGLALEPAGAPVADH